MAEKIDIIDEQNNTALRRKNIALCLSGIDSERESIFKATITKRALKLGYNVCIFVCLGRYDKGSPHDVGEINIFNLVNFDKFSGLIITPETIKHVPTYQRLLDEARKRDIPVVSIDYYVEGCYNITLPHNKSIEKIVNHFIEHHKFRYINFINGMPGNLVSDQRLAVYKRTLEKHNIPFEEKRVGYAFFWHKHARGVVDEFMKQDPKPQVIVCANDSMAIGAIERLEELGYRVPEDVCVSGYDGIEMAVNYTPSITTSMISKKQCSNLAVDIIDKHLKGLPVEKDYEMEHSYNFAESCGCNDKVITHSKISKFAVIDNLNDANAFSNQMIRLTELITGTSSLEKAAELLVRSARHAYCERLWFFLVDDFEEDSIKGSNIYDDSSYNTVGYTDKMRVFLSMKDTLRYFDDVPTFETSEMLPDFQSNMDKFRAMIFLPLHFQDRPSGYFAMSFSSYEINYNFMHTWLLNVSSILENIRIQLKTKKLAQKYKELYIIDTLTGLYNRRGFYNHVNKIMQKAIAEQQMLTVVSIDLDDLKPINDLFGHFNGDIAINTVANAIKEISSENHLSARFGGDEFVILASNCDENDAQAFLQAFSEKINHFNMTSDKPYIVDASCGSYTAIPQENESIDDYIKYADDKMYINKVERKSNKKLRNTRREFSKR